MIRTLIVDDQALVQPIAAIRVVAAGDALLSSSLTKRVIEEFSRHSAPPVAQVLGQIARGLSNAELARDLFVGKTTVKTHVTRILMKLGLRDRVQAVVYAYESGLVQPGSRS